MPAHVHHGHPTGRGGLKPLSNGIKPQKPDEVLWHECQKIVPASKWEPMKLPHFCGLIDGGVAVYLVDGNKVKVEKDPDFTEGGNGEEAPWICGKKEIYLDAQHDWEDLKYVAYHEAIERRTMHDRGWSYEKAHELANRHEMELRRRDLKAQGVKIHRGLHAL